MAAMWKVMIMFGLLGITADGHEVITCLLEEEPTPVALSCIDAEMIAVSQSFLAVSQPGSNMDCEAPSTNPGDCQDQLVMMTEDMRATCNTKRTCTHTVPSNPALSACDSTHDDAQVYMFTSFSCVPSEAARGLPTGSLDPLHPPMSQVTGYRVDLQTAGYPSAFSDITYGLMCLVQLDPGHKVSLTILDLSYASTGTSSGDVPYFMNIQVPDEMPTRIPAYQGQRFPGLTINGSPEGEVYMWFAATSTDPVLARFWILLTPVDFSSGSTTGDETMTVKCGMSIFGPQFTTSAIGGVPQLPGTEEEMPETQRPTLPPQSPVGATDPPSNQTVVFCSVAGVLVVLIIIAVIALFFGCRRRPQKQDPLYEDIPHDLRVTGEPMETGKGPGGLEKAQFQNNLYNLGITGVDNKCYGLNNGVADNQNTQNQCYAMQNGGPLEPTTENGCYAMENGTPSQVTTDNQCYAMENNEPSKLSQVD